MSLPREFQTREIRRYGFHGLSYEYVIEALRERGVDIENERIIVAHLGNGASMCAIKHGQSIETTIREAVDLFCYRARSCLAALTAVLGGLDRLVFTGGIGANASEIRERICDGLGYLGIELDNGANNAGASTISTPKATVTVQALASDEERMIARHVLRFAADPAHIREASHS